MSTLREDLNKALGRIAALEAEVRSLRPKYPLNPDSHRIERAFAMLKANRNRDLYETQTPGRFCMTHDPQRYCPTLNEADIQMMLDSGRLVDKWPGKNLRYWTLAE